MDIKLKNGLTITGATLLSVEEYDKHKDNIPPVDIQYWLRSPGYICDNALTVKDGVGPDSNNVLSECFYVRPALCLDSLGDMAVGDKFEISGYPFTIISDGLALCDKDVNRIAFRNHDGLSDMLHLVDYGIMSEDEYANYCDSICANDYEHSSVKKLVEEWFFKEKIADKWLSAEKEDDIEEER